ncbi:MAG: ABC transporter ATP-binding protein/permease [Candidatus Peribacteria bacterium]|nr:ABC transporter ATP-binding protein/permease [Candidatus Peribacteria bacterium]
MGSFERFTDTLNRSVLPFILNVIIILIIIGTQHFWLAIGLLGVITICAIAQYKLFRWAYPYQDKANSLDTKLGGVLSDDITNNFNIKIFSSLEKETKTFATVNHANAQARKTYFYKMMRVWGVARGLTGLILEIGTIYISLLLRGQGIIEIGVIVLLQTYVLTLIQQLGEMGNTFRNFFRCMAEIGEVVEIIDTPHSVIDHSDKKLKVRKGEIRFENVSFSYNDKNPVFEQLSFQIKPGERIGLV